MLHSCIQSKKTVDEVICIPSKDCPSYEPQNVAWTDWKWWFFVHLHASIGYWATVYILHHIKYIAYLYFVLVTNVPIDIFVSQKASVPPFVWVLHPLSNNSLNTISCVTGFCHESRCSTQETVVFLRSFRSWGRIATEMYGHLQTMPFLWSSFGCIYHGLRMDTYRFEVTNPPLKKETSGPEDNWATIPYYSTRKQVWLANFEMGGSDWGVFVAYPY